MRNPFSFLTEQSNGFLSKIAVVRERPDQLIELEAHYAIEAYDRSLFDVFGIDFPPKLINAVPKRLSEFLAGRILAHAALERLQHASAPITIGDWGSPVWPAGICGSISHSQGKCACLVIAGDDKLVGIDIERIPTGASLQAILQEALNAEERDRILRQATFDAGTLATLIFSAKETLYKALHPVVLEFFGFDAAVFNGIYGDTVLSLSVVHALHAAIPLNQEILIQFAIDGEFVRTWAILERGSLHSFR